MNYSEDPGGEHAGWTSTLWGIFCAPSRVFILGTLKQRKCPFVILRIIRVQQILNFLIAFLGNAHLAKPWYVENDGSANHARHFLHYRIRAILLLVGLSDGRDGEYCQQTSRDANTCKGFQFSHRRNRYLNSPTLHVGAASLL